MRVHVVRSEALTSVSHPSLAVASRGASAPTVVSCLSLSLSLTLSLITIRISYHDSRSVFPFQVLDGREPLATIKEAKSVLFTHESGELFVV